ncbi:MAG: hypothetical protein DME69_14060 [Verrucomicrobia bacterium]|nr:MAG: hypothetical protein DME69_14060 [Verrucomicrobiota bacterium]
MPQSPGEPDPTEARVEPTNSEEFDQANSRHDLYEAASEESSTAAEGAAESEDWWTTPEPGAIDWAKPASSASATQIDPPKKSDTADVCFCGQTSLFPLNRALQAIAKEKLTGTLRSFWDKEPIDLLAGNGEIIFVTTRDSELYCPETPAVLANVDAEIVAKARSQQSETGTSFFLTLARQESIARQPAMELMQHYGQRLFSQLWTSPRVWIMFEKNADLLSDAADVSREPDGFERVQKLKLTSDEAQFASQFNGVRSVQQIAKNLRLDLKSAHLTLFRFLALEIVECWPASTAIKPERKSVLQRFRRSR